MKESIVAISRFPIKLGQFMKYASIVSDGVEGKVLISNGEVSVNGKQEFRRGKQLFSGDTILVHATNYICVDHEK